MKTLKSKLDFFGGAASLLCALHCMVLPAAAAAGLLGGLAWLGGRWGEWAFIALSLVLALASLAPAYRLKHGSALPLLIATLGFLLLFSSQAGEVHRHYLSALGGLSIAGAHFLNWRLLRYGQKSCNASPLNRPKLSRVLVLILLLGYLFLIKTSDNTTPQSRGELLETVWKNK
jgi:hypothetical protein